ncbi:DUF6950 family protein [Methylobrevis pamukkalensis]|uniref:DUF6950 domain-containing protein n=1 Tax=Methylobrevis pamukkalensis TaxID=1439726 RepID=A0A1E3GZQ1_9HYPH|nr:hypothetical protein [Methylobrevis pamukkalensis]ODN69558.1 hypothetical protein A6302_03152 [Methylobrevis pamukkalensis]
MIDGARVQDFAARQGRIAARWGVSDCSIRLGDWTREAAGIDAAAPVRGTYDSALTCARLLRREGGLDRLVARLMAGAGFCPTDEHDLPGVGAVGVIGLPGRLFHQWGASATARTGSCSAGMASTGIAPPRWTR